MPPKTIKLTQLKIYKSRSAQRNNTVDTIDKSGSIPGANLFNRSTRIEKPTEIYIFKDNKDLSDLFGQGDDLAGITSEIIRINRKKKNLDTLIIRK